MNWNYGASCFIQPEEKLPPEHAHHKIGRSMMQECQDIKDGLEISRQRRPQWDEETLHALNCQEILVRTDISACIYLAQDEFYNPVPMFSVMAIKE